LALKDGEFVLISFYGSTLWVGQQSVSGFMVKLALVFRSAGSSMSEVLTMGNSALEMLEEKKCLC
jgi:hypothetical protein